MAGLQDGSVTLDLQLAYWDGVGPSKPFSHPVNVTRLQSILPPSAAVLDYGCGYGRVLELLSLHGFGHLTGVDPAPAMVAAARRHAPGAAVELLDDPPRVARPDGSFDAALLVAVLTCVPTDEGQRAIVAELDRLLRPGGALFVSDLWLQADVRNRERYELGARTHGTYGVFDLPEGVTVRHHDPAWIRTLTAGFDVVALEDMELTTMNGHQARGFQWIGRKRG